MAPEPRVRHSFRPCATSTTASSSRTVEPSNWCRSAWSAEDGREFYAVSTEFDPDRPGRWVRTNVLPKLPQPSSPLWRSARGSATTCSSSSFRGRGRAELWAWVAAYDHVALCQLWGDDDRTAAVVPRFTRELRQHWEDSGQPAAARRRPTTRTTRWPTPGTTCAKFEAIAAVTALTGGALSPIGLRRSR